MRTLLARLWLAAVCGSLVLGSASSAIAASTAKGGVVLSRVAVTATNIHGDSAVSMSISNDSKGPISLLSISSPDTSASMIDYDTNMCQGNHAMMLLSNILITSGRQQALGYKYQGAMLRDVKERFAKGATIPVVITWSNFRTAHSVTVEARIVAPPRHLNFGMASMKM